MPKIITLRLSDEEYKLLARAAESVKRPISNLISYLALKKLEEDIFIDQIEMDEILADTVLTERLKRGARQAAEMKGSFVDV